MNPLRYLFLVLLAAMLGGCADEPPAEFMLSYATPYPPSHPFSQADLEWMAHIERQSGGRIGFRPFWSGSLITADMSMLEIRHGLTDIGLITPIYTKAGTHLLRAQTGFYGGVQTIEDQIAVYHCLSDEFEQFDRELEGLEVLAVQGGNFPGILTRDKPIENLDDLKGMRLRVQTEAVDVLRQLGADPVIMPMGEVYSALAKGIIDGVVAPADTIHSLRFSEVASHFTRLRFSRGAYPARAISEKSLSRLPANLSQLLLNAHPVWEQAMARELYKAEQTGHQFGLDNGIVFHDFPDSEQARLDALYNEVALDEARALQSLDINAEPILSRAQALIDAGSPIQCNRM